MTKIEIDLSLMLLKLCEELLPKTKIAGDVKVTAVMKKVRQHLEGQAGEASATDPAK